MKNFKYILVFASMLFSVNNWSMTVSQICSLNPATTTCKELYDSFLVDVLQQLKSEGKGFDKEDYVNKKIDHAQNELELAQQSQKHQAHRPKVLMEKPASNISKIFDAFRSFWHGVLSFLSNFLALLNMTGIESEPEPEEAGVGQDSTNAKTAASPNKQNLDPRLKINDLRRQIAMYKEILVTLPAIGDTPDFLIKSDDGWWLVNFGGYGVKDKKELKAFSVMLTWLEVDSLSIMFAKEFATTDYSDFLNEFKNAIITNNALSSLTLGVNGFVDNFIAKQLANKIFSPTFASSLARKNLRSIESNSKTLKELSLLGLYGVNEFLENFITHDRTFNDWLNPDPFQRVPHFDSLEILTISEEEPLSEKSLKTLEGLLINGLKKLSLALTEDQQKADKEHHRMWKKMYSDLFDPSITMNKELALQKLTFSGMNDEDVAAFIRYLATKKNNLEELALTDFKEVNHSKKLLDALTKIYSNEWDIILPSLPSSSSYLKLKTLSYSGKRGGSFDKEREKNMSDFLIALATSEKAKNLDNLEISQSRLTDDNIKVFAQAIEQGRNLCPSIMGLSFNAISIDSAWVLADSIKQACDKKVEKLELTGNFKSAAAKNLISVYKPYFEISVY